MDLVAMYAVEVRALTDNRPFTPNSLTVHPPTESWVFRAQHRTRRGRRDALAANSTHDALGTSRPGPGGSVFRTICEWQETGHFM